MNPSRGPAQSVFSRAWRGTPHPSGLYPPLGKLPLPRWVWIIVTWALVGLVLILLPHIPWVLFGFFGIFSLIWWVYTKWWAAVLAHLVVGGLVSVSLVVAGLKEGLPMVWVAVTVTLVTGTWVTWVYFARFDALAALKEKEQTMQALAQAQDELSRAERAAGRAAERERWSREVHDTLAQGFVSIITLTQAAAAELGTQPEDQVRQRLVQVEEVARDNLAEARALLSDQPSPQLDNHSLVEALNRHLQTLDQHGIHTRLSYEVSSSLPSAIQVVVLRIVQESLSNVVRHAQAENVTVEVTGHDGELVVFVSDDGIGAGGAVEGTGLRGMRTRVESLGGSLVLAPRHPTDTPDRTGTLVRATIPL